MITGLIASYGLTIIVVFCIFALAIQELQMADPFADRSETFDVWYAYAFGRDYEPSESEKEKTESQGTLHNIVVPCVTALFLTFLVLTLPLWGTWALLSFPAMREWIEKGRPMSTAACTKCRKRWVQPQIIKDRDQIRAELAEHMLLEHPQPTTTRAVCDQCDAVYQVPNEHLKKPVNKTTCRQCGHRMFIDGPPKE